MWSNYILTSFRTLSRNKLFVGINLLSIALAFSLCTIAYFNIQFNRDFNKHFSKASDLYKINSHMISPQGDKIQGTTPLPLAAAITNDFPGIKSAKIQHVAFAVKIEDQKFRESISFVDHGFLDLFEVQTQDEKQARFDNNNDVYISQALATKYFGKRQAIGQIIQVPLAKDNSLQLVVAGILADLPENTSFHMNLLVPFAQYLNIYDLAENDWLNWVDGTFLFSEQLNTESISEAMMKYIEVQNTVNKGQEVSNYQIDSILKWPAFENTLEKSSFVSLLHPASVLGTLSSAIAVLLLASFNFINTSIAISRRRLKEIGMRKVLGGRKRDLKIQFLIESLVQMFIAIGFSGIITYFLSQAYNAMFSFEIVEFSRIKLLPFLGFMLLIWLATGLLAGMYPAFYISKFESIEIFRNKVRFTRKNVFMKVLLTFQLMVCIYNVFSLIVFIQNAQYQEKLDRGYTVDDSINIPLSNSEQFESLKSSLDGMPLVKRVTGTVDPIGFSSKNIAIDYQGTQKDVASITVGQGYLESLRVRLNTGNFFGVNEEVNKTQIMINSMLADKLPGDLLNNWIRKDGIQYEVIGIVDDFNLEPIMLDNKIQPTVIFCIPQTNFIYAHVSLNSKDVLAINDSLALTWNKLYPDELYGGFPQEDVLGAVRETNTIMLNINGFVALITLTISAMGLYAMVYLNIQSRIKEFGVRKVLGAPIHHILYLINKEVMAMFVIASIFGLTLGYFVISQILEIVYAYHREIERDNYIWPVIILFIIIGIAIGFRSIKSARENPVKQLRFE